MRLLKRSPGAYFNDGKRSMMFQQNAELKEPNPRLVKVINAAWKAFNRAYKKEFPPVSEQGARLRDAAGKEDVGGASPQAQEPTQ